MDLVCSSNQENQLRLTRSQTHVSNCPYTQIQSLKSILITFACVEYKESNSSVRLVTENFATHEQTHAICSQRSELSTLSWFSGYLPLCHKIYIYIAISWYFSVVCVIYWLLILEDKYIDNSSLDNFSPFSPHLPLSYQYILIGLLFSFYIIMTMYMQFAAKLYALIVFTFWDITFCLPGINNCLEI